MAVNNRQDFLAERAADGEIITNHLYFGNNRLVAPGTYTTNYDTGEYDSVTFRGTAGRDVLLGGGGELYDFFVASAGNDIYGVDYTPDAADFVSAYVDYSAAPKGVVIDMSYRGSQTFTDESGATRTESIVGKAWDGFGGTDYFTEFDGFGVTGFSSIFGVFGSSHRDVLIGGGSLVFYGGGGNDLLNGQFLRGGNGKDVLIGIDDGSIGAQLEGENGNDVLYGTDLRDYRLLGGAGNDRLFAGGGNDIVIDGGEGHDYISAGDGDDAYIVAGSGNDTVDGGLGNDFLDGGVGRDVLISGAGSDVINPDVEYFQTDPTRATDHARDVIRVSRADVGDFNDVVLSRAFEAGRDEIRFYDAVRCGVDYRIYSEAISINEATGQPYRPTLIGEDRADLQNTVLQIDQDGGGFGGTVPDTNDYFLFVVDTTLTEHWGYLLT